MPPKVLLIAVGVAVVAWVGLALHLETLGLRGGFEFDVAPAHLTAAELGLDILMRIIVSLVLLLAALWVVLSQRYQPTDRHWAYGIIGTVVGFWLHS